MERDDGCHRAPKGSRRVCSLDTAAAIAVAIDERAVARIEGRRACAARSRARRRDVGFLAVVALPRRRPGAIGRDRPRHRCRWAAANNRRSGSNSSRPAAGRLAKPQQHRSLHRARRRPQRHGCRRVRRRGSRRPHRRQIAPPIASCAAACRGGIRVASASSATIANLPIIRWFSEGVMLPYHDSQVRPVPVKPGQGPI